MSRYHYRAFTNNGHENLALEDHAQHSLVREQVFLLVFAAVAIMPNTSVPKKIRWSTTTKQRTTLHENSPRYGSPHTHTQEQQRLKSITSTHLRMQHQKHIKMPLDLRTHIKPQKNAPRLDYTNEGKQRVHATIKNSMQKLSHPKSNCSCKVLHKQP